jgi:hypothetical protein
MRESKLSVVSPAVMLVFRAALAQSSAASDFALADDNDDIVDEFGALPRSLSQADEATGI